MRHQQEVRPLPIPRLCPARVPTPAVQVVMVAKVPCQACPVRLIWEVQCRADLAALPRRCPAHREWVGQCQAVEVGVGLQCQWQWAAVNRLLVTPEEIQVPMATLAQTALTQTDKLQQSHRAPETLMHGLTKTTCQPLVNMIRKFSTQ